MNHRTASAAGLAPLALAALTLGGSAPATAQTRTQVIPADTVVKARLNDAISSKTARIGQRFTATVAPDDRSGLPEGTRFEGTITDARAKTAQRPGVIGMDFRTAILPDGARVAMSGQLASLADQDVRRTSDGRLESRKKDSGGKFDLKWVGYGAVAGAVLGELLGSNFLKGALLGGLGGAVYGYLNRDKGSSGGEKIREVKLSPGQEFGIRIDQRLAFTERPSYRYARNDDLNRDERVAGARQEFRYGVPTVMYGGRSVRFSEQQPLHLNGILYMPLSEVAREANMRFTHQAGEEDFQLVNGQETIQGRVGQVDYRTRDGLSRIDMAPIAINGEIFVTTEFLSRVAGLSVDYDRNSNRVNIDRY